MRSQPDLTLPSITFVLSQAPPAAPRGGKRWNKRLGVRRSKSSPSFAPHPPRYPPRLDSEFLTTVDYRFSSPPPRAPSRSSFALPKDIFDSDAEIEIVMSSPTESESSTDAGCSTTTHSCSYHHHAQHDDRSHAHRRGKSRSYHGHGGASAGQCSSLGCAGHASSARTQRRARTVTAFIHDTLSALRSRWHGTTRAVRRAEHRVPFDLCD